MASVHLFIEDKVISQKYQKYLSSRYHVVEWSNPQTMLSSPNVNLGDVAIVDENWAQKNKKLIYAAEFPFFIILMNHPNRVVAPNEIAPRSLEFMQNGAVECVTRNMSKMEITGVIDFVLFQQYEKIPKPAKNQWIKVAASFVVVAAVTFLFGFLFSQKSPFATINDPQEERFFHSLTPSPSGIAVHGNLVWISDWYSQTITTYEVGNDLILRGRFAFEHFSPIAVAKAEDGLWSLGNDYKIRLHALSDTLPITKVLEIDESPLAGLYWDGEYLWSCNNQKKEILKLKIGFKVEVLERFPVSAQDPIGIVKNDNKIWIMDGHSGEILFYEMKKNGISLKRKMGLPYFKEEMNRPAGFGGDGQTLWVTADKSGLVYSLKAYNG